MLGQLDTPDIVIADFEAGLGNLTRLKPGDLDLFLIVTDPTAKALEVARRARDLLRDKALGPANVIANRLLGGEDVDRVIAALGGERPQAAIPEDPALRSLDASGEAPFDGVPDAPAVVAIRRLAADIVSRGSSPEVR